jgi:ligand-binding sensor domain-containing protein
VPERLYRIEIDVLLDDRMRSKVIQVARDDYRSSGGYWTEEDGEKVRITDEEFVVDTKTAFLQIVDSVFRKLLPEIEPQVLRCGIEKISDVRHTLRARQSRRARKNHL